MRTGALALWAGTEGVGLWRPRGEMDLEKQTGSLQCLGQIIKKFGSMLFMAQKGQWAHIETSDIQTRYAEIYI